MMISQNIHITFFMRTRYSWTFKWQQQDILGDMYREKITHIQYLTRKEATTRNLIFSSFLLFSSSSNFVLRLSYICRENGRHSHEGKWSCAMFLSVYLKLLKIFIFKIEIFLLSIAQLRPMLCEGFFESLTIILETYNRHENEIKKRGKGDEPETMRNVSSFPFLSFRSTYKKIKDKFLFEEFQVLLLMLMLYTMLPLALGVAGCSC